MDTVMYIGVGLLVAVIAVPWFLLILSPFFVAMSTVMAPVAFVGAKKIEKMRIEALRVLVVDDDVVSVTPLLLLLSQQGLGVDIASSGREAVQKLTENEYDLIFLDFSMPDLNGMQVLLESDRKVKNTRKIPVVFYTGFSQHVPQFKTEHFQITDTVSKELALLDLGNRLEKTIHSPGAA